MNYIKLLIKLFMLKGNEKKSAEQIRKIQELKLKKLLGFACKNSEYSKKTFEARGINEKNIDNAIQERSDIIIEEVIKNL